ncbi:glutamine amidotransferase-related protein, partial [Schwartzia sp. (in: firmicutes)]
NQDNGLFKGLSGQPYVYFVHSFHAVPDKSDIITSVTEYGEKLTASVAYKNILATQFHPEKSGDVGLQILKNFLDY